MRRPSVTFSTIRHLLIIVAWPTTSCFADWSKRRQVTLSIIECWTCRRSTDSHYNVTPGVREAVTWPSLNANVKYILRCFCLRFVYFALPPSCRQNSHAAILWVKLRNAVLPTSCRQISHAAILWVKPSETPPSRRRNYHAAILWNGLNCYLRWSTVQNW